ncbi:hypothetical protein BDF22DRAFT_654410 [Syncephalis plumigaleata]|nr:hypothetical protein BDF22DRAFT_654410 [Syncephalis plumigaleata]
MHVLKRERELEEIKKEMWEPSSLKQCLQQCLKAKLRLAMSQHQLQLAFEQAVDIIFKGPYISEDEREIVYAHRDYWSATWIRLVLYFSYEGRWDMLSLMIDCLDTSVSLPTCFKRLFDDYNIFPSNTSFAVLRRPIIELNPDMVIGDWVIEAKLAETNEEQILRVYSCSVAGRREIALHKYIRSLPEISDYVPPIVTTGETLQMPAIITQFVEKQEPMLYSNREQIQLALNLFKMLTLLHENNIRIDSLRPSNVVVKRATLDFIILNLESVHLVEGAMPISNEFGDAIEEQWTYRSFNNNSNNKEFGCPIYAKLAGQLLTHFLGVSNACNPTRTFPPHLHD